MSKDDDTSQEDRLVSTALRPAAKEFSRSSTGAGAALGRTALVGAKSIEVLLSPLAAMVWGFDQIRDKIVPNIEEKIKKIPEERLTTPELMIAGPTLDSLKYTAHKDELREMFENLLVTSMDTQTEHLAHPSFVEIIKQISPDKALILNHLKNIDSIPIIDIIQRRKNAIDFKNLIQNITLIEEEIKLYQPKNISSYIDNLCRLKLFEIPFSSAYSNKNFYRKFENHPEIKKFIQAIEASGEHTAYINNKVLVVSEFGKKFISACVIKT